MWMPCSANQAPARRRNAGGGGALFVGQDFGVALPGVIVPGVIVHGGVDVVVADPAAADGFAAAVGFPAAAVGDPADLLDVHVDQLARLLAFVAARAGPGGGAGSDRCAGEWVALGQPRHAVAAQDPPAGGGRYAGVAGQPGRAAAGVAAGLE